MDETEQITKDQALDRVLNRSYRLQALGKVLMTKLEGAEEERLGTHDLNQSDAYMLATMIVDLGYEVQQLTDRSFKEAV